MQKAGIWFDYLPPILYMPVPQTGHFPFMAFFPFFIVTAWALGSSLFALHFTQYIDAINSLHPLSLKIFHHKFNY